MAIYAIGGFADGATTAKVEKYDGSSWSNIPDMNTARRRFAAASDADGNIYALGGQDAGSSAEKWDGSSWSTITDMPIEKQIFAAESDSNSNIYTLAGFTGEGFGRTFYDSRVDVWDGSSWSSISDISTARRGHGAGRDADDNIYVIGGENGDGVLASVERWDGSSWSSVADMPTPRELVAYATDSNGNIYVAGGADSSGSEVATVEKWDGSSWTSLPDMPTARFRAGAVVDENDDLYVIGGSPSTDVVEKWDGSSWSSVASISQDTTSLEAVNDLPILEAPAAPSNLNLSLQ